MMNRAKTMDEWKEQMAEYEARRDAAMAEVNVQVGDQVEYHAVSPFGQVEVSTGIVFIAKNGAAKVRLIGSRQTKNWHKGWRK